MERFKDDFVHAPNVGETGRQVMERPRTLSGGERAALKYTCMDIWVYLPFRDEAGSGRLVEDNGVAATADLVVLSGM